MSSHHRNSRDDRRRRDDPSIADTESIMSTETAPSHTSSRHTSSRRQNEYRGDTEDILPRETAPSHTSSRHTGRRGGNEYRGDTEDVLPRETAPSHTSSRHTGSRGQNGSRQDDPSIGDTESILSRASAPHTSSRHTGSRGQNGSRQDDPSIGDTESILSRGTAPSQGSSRTVHGHRDRGGHDDRRDRAPNPDARSLRQPQREPTSSASQPKPKPHKSLTVINTSTPLGIIKAYGDQKAKERKKQKRAVEKTRDAARAEGKAPHKPITRGAYVRDRNDPSAGTKMVTKHVHAKLVDGQVPGYAPARAAPLGISGSGGYDSRAGAPIERSSRDHRSRDLPPRHSNRPRSVSSAGSRDLQRDFEGMSESYSESESESGSGSESDAYEHSPPPSYAELRARNRR